MKSILLFLFLFGSNLLFSQWELQNSGTTEDLNDVHCITDDTVMVVGNNGTIIRTLDGGNQWTAVTSPVTENLNEVQFANPSAGYIIGNQGIILKSVDAGATWQALNTGISADLLSLYVVSADTVYVGGSGGMIIKTVDGGSNWTIINFPFTNSVWDLEKPSFSALYVITEPDSTNQTARLYKSTDEGISWDTLVFNYYPAFRLLKFYNENEAIVTFSNIDFIEPFGKISHDTLPDIYFIYPYFIKENIKDIFVKTPDTVWVAGSDENTTMDPAYVGTYTLESSAYRTHIYRSSDTPPYTALDFSSTGIGYLTGINGIIRKNPTGDIGPWTTPFVDKNNQQFFSLYPNPANTTVEIAFKTTGSNPKLWLYDNNGKLMVSIRVKDRYKLNVGTLPDGLYWVKISDQHFTAMEKLLVRHGDE